MTLKLRYNHFNNSATKLINGGDTKLRSIVKASTWRIIASLDTMVISFFVTGGDIRKAVAIGGFEIITKLIIYFFHERAWNYIKWGKRVEEFSHVKTVDTKRRSLAKAVTWRIFGTLDTFIISGFFTKSLKHASSIALIELLTKPLLYFLHERFWNNLMWGKR